MCKSQHFRDWWMSEAVRAYAINLPELLREAAWALRNREKFDANLLKVLADRLNPIIQKLSVSVEHRVNAQLVDENVDEQISQYLDDKAKGVLCEHCGGPEIDWSMMRTGEPALPVPYEEVSTDAESV